MNDYSSNTLWQLDACEMAAGIAKRDFSSRELVSACLSRIDDVNPLINAITETRADSALAQADAADKALAAGKNHQGLLHGLPVTIKHNVDVEGWATVHGSEAMKDNIAPGNSDCVQNWLDAGAIIIGRTNNPEFCCRWETSNEVFGVTHNPWDRARTPGGSSGGAAASLAVGMTPLAHGTDLGGSLRHPAQACGITSIKPSFGRVADWHPSDHSDPAIGYQLMNTDGPMARHVRDVRLGLKAMSARNYHDPWWVPAPLVSKAEKRTIALVTNPAGQGIDPQVASGVERAGQLLEAAGYKVEVVEPPGVEEAAEIWRIICIGELTSQLAPAVGGFCGDRLRTALEYYKDMVPDFSMELYMNAFGRRRKVLRDWLAFFETYDLIVAPICTETPLATDADLVSAESAVEIVHSHRMTVAISALSLPAAVVPVGISENMPQAVQIIGAPFTEMDCLDAAEAIERQLMSFTPIDPK
ncbi:MAG: amidase [Halioglobus sp.]|jgi:amidase